MIVLGVDPGTATTGYGVVAMNADGALVHHAHGVVTTAPSLAPAERLLRIYDELTALIEATQPDVVAVEELFFKKNVKTGISVAQARGVVMLAAAKAGIEVANYKPMEVKQGVVGVGGASKGQVRFMTKTLLGLRELPKPDDAADGLAIAICHLHRTPAQARVSHAST